MPVVERVKLAINLVGSRDRRELIYINDRRLRRGVFSYAASCRLRGVNMSSINIPSIPSSIRWTIQKDGAVLLNVESGLMYSVNEVGSLIWERLSQGVGLDEIATSIADGFGISIEDARNDVRSFVGDLLLKRLIAAEA